MKEFKTKIGQELLRHLETLERVNALGFNLSTAISNVKKVAYRLLEYEAA